MQEAEEAGEEPEAWVVDGLRESLMVVRMLRAHVGAVVSRGGAGEAQRAGRVCL